MLTQRQMRFVREYDAGGDAAEAAVPYCPDRADFVLLWRECGGRFALGEDLASVLASCPEGMAPERYCICLNALLDSGLLRSRGGKVYGAESAELEGKADLEATGTMRRLRSLQ